MHRFFRVWLFVLICSSCFETMAANIRRPKPWGLSANLGYSEISFSGVTGADFSAFKHYHIDLALLRFPKGSWQWFGLGLNLVPDLSFKDVRWNDGSSGNYLSSFQTIYGFWGGHHKAFRWAFMVGNETMSWKGSPETGANKPTYWTPGLMVGWIWKQKNQLNFPLYFRYWQKPERTLKFSQLPNDSINAKSGAAYELDVGVHYGF